MFQNIFRLFKCELYENDFTDKYMYNIWIYRSMTTSKFRVETDWIIIRTRLCLHIWDCFEDAIKCNNQHTNVHCLFTRNYNNVWWLMNAEKMYVPTLFSSQLTIRLLWDHHHLKHLRSWKGTRLNKLEDENYHTYGIQCSYWFREAKITNGNLCLTILVMSKLHSQSLDWKMEKIGKRYAGNNI